MSGPRGWPAGLYLAALYLRQGGSLASAAFSFGGDDRLVSDYMESEFLSRISRQQRAFLTRTAVLERICGPLCDAVLQVSGSAAVLAELAGANMLLVPLDRRGEWYRYHHLFRDMLLAELHRREPALMPVLRRRAAGWYLDNDMPEAALEYCMVAGDVDGAARLVGPLTVSAYRQGRVATIQRWYGWLEDRGGIGRHPMAAVLASFFSALMGRPVTPSGGPMRSTAGSTGTRPGPRTLPQRHGPSWSAPCCAGAGLSGCAPTPTRRYEGSRRRPS